ncbi:flagellar P-ring protein [Desulfosarcina ovata subsp. sediminis]|uniref:Flagellar P-ring protein n=1 Tax=Desulfosarcina ovata subsp. sediminis TaxID=885957 RepID=A0A5K7ZJC8_9BACT|nr:flagellar basal body P-ring protein FlgI [Desulfosarcina ovata]BBO79819.1 flagellar P-ring protein [Desulfosarcina ovata subsp. sediminis]
MKSIRYYLIFVLLAGLALGWRGSAGAVRLKDISEINGVRSNQLVGYGLAVGLNGSGDGKKAIFTVQSMASMLEKMGVTIAQDDIKVKNVAAVMVTANLPPFAKRGNSIDVLVSSIGDASSLQGGTLMLTPLKGIDGKIYAVAQGPINIGGFSAGGAAASTVKNFPTVGRVLSGATIEREVPNAFGNQGTVLFSLHHPDFTTATRVVDSVNAQLGAIYARAKDPGTIEIRVPPKYLGNTVPLLASLGNLEVAPDADAKVVINERTGTVVMGEQVRISTIAIAHGNLSIIVKENMDTSQPLPLSDGQTVVTPDTEVFVQEAGNQLVVVPKGVNIGQVVNALNALGVTPRDLIAIFQAIKAAGALQADLEVI